MVTAATPMSGKEMIRNFNIEIPVKRKAYTQYIFQVALLIIRRE